MIREKRNPFLIIGILILSTACSTPSLVQNNGTTGSVDVPESEATVQLSERAERTDLSELFWARMDSLKMNFTDADVSFMSGMIGHHAQALIMSSMATVNEASPSVTTLTKRIINAQKDEIGIMQRWLSERGQTVPQVTIDGLQLIITPGDEPSLVFDPEQVAHAVHHFNEHGTYMDNAHYTEMHGAGAMSHDMHEGMQHGEAEGHNEGAMSHDMHEGMEHGEEQGHGEGAMSHMGMHDHSNMPGMLTQAQLEELARAKGAEFDQLFLTYMIQHHTGAIIMVKDLVETDGAAQEIQIGKLAGEINVDQTTEIERMRIMLMELVGLGD
jgi:uncharacterized protein (DUF305 family)